MFENIRERSNDYIDSTTIRSTQARSLGYTVRRGAELSVECVIPARARLGESPVWSEAESLLYWVDIDGRRIHRFSPSTGLDESFAVTGRSP